MRTAAAATPASAAAAPPPPERLHLPHDPGPYRMAMGLTPTVELVEVDDRYPAAMAERRHLLATRHRDVFAITPGSDAARAETLSYLAAWLARRHPAWFAQDGARLHNRLTGEAWDLARPAHDPLEVAGRLVQEDLCLIDADGPEPLLSAAILCAPSRWRLADKIGRPLADVHGPVPLYAARLSGPVDRFIRALRPGRIVERQNWGVYDDGALFQPSPETPRGPDPSVAAETLFYRVERQTLTRLPGSGAVLFAIRVHSYPLARVLAAPGAAGRLAAAVRALPDGMAAYKGLPRYRDALLARLDGAARPV